MAKVEKISGYDEFIASIEKLAASADNVNILFTGKKDESGRSWCPDCVDAEPYVNKHCIENAEPNSLFVVVDVGDRTTWKDIKNPFRLDRNTHLSVIPTLINWKEKAKRLEGDQLCKPELFDIYFEQD
ncbi:thioredoxin domain-containing protein 17-like [Contarinia nasturtii]|uniref:thioredoxin domain-containing protein 17-like n=1 Tax=Contarinia nasturtii TaxID=265458 RepID=UPI0012D3B4E0|nr:thioredoxin domain-containing protein 17-like [Contarinia nasturtii]